jgi:hypothetical protein
MKKIKPELHRVKMGLKRFSNFHQKSTMLCCLGRVDILAAQMTLTSAAPHKTPARSPVRANTPQTANAALVHGVRNRTACARLARLDILVLLLSVRVYEWMAAGRHSSRHTGRIPHPTPLKRLPKHSTGRLPYLCNAHINIVLHCNPFVNNQKGAARTAPH